MTSVNDSILIEINSALLFQQESYKQTISFTRLVFCNKTVQVPHVSNYDICPVLRSDIYCGEISVDMNVKLAVNYVLNDQLNSQSLEDKEKQTECI